MQGYTVKYVKDIVLLQYKSLSLTRYMYITEEQFLWLASNVIRIIVI